MHDFLPRHSLERTLRPPLRDTYDGHAFLGAVAWALAGCLTKASLAVTRSIHASRAWNHDRGAAEAAQLRQPTLVESDPASSSADRDAVLSDAAVRAA